MNTAKIDATIKKHLHRIAPEADLQMLDPDSDLGRTLDLDSMDFYTMMVAISDDFQVEIPEEEYERLRSVRSIREFLEKATRPH